MRGYTVYRTPYSSAAFIDFDKLLRMLETQNLCNQALYKTTHVIRISPRPLANKAMFFLRGSDKKPIPLLA